MKEHVTGKILNAEEMRSLRLKNSSVWLSKPAGSMLEQFRRENSCRPSMIPCISSLGIQESDRHRMSSNRHGFCSNGGGNEHDVLIQPSGRRVLKITQPGNGYGARSRLTDYLENHLMANILFGDDIRVEYIVYGTHREDMPMIVVSQPFIEGTRASEEEISSFWESLDFRKCSRHSFRHPCGTTIHDARPDNIYRSPDGFLFPIDVQVLHGMRYLRYKLLQLLAGQA